MRLEKISLELYAFGNQSPKQISKILNLEKKEINLSVLGQEGKTHNKLTNRRNFIMLNDFNLAS